MRAIAVALLLAACKVSGMTFVSPDAEGETADAQPDAAPGTALFVISDGTLAMSEGTTKDITIAIDAAPPLPTEDIIVMVASGDPTKVAVNKDLLLFTLANLATPQTVTLSATTDADFNFAKSTISITSSKVTGPATVNVTVVEPAILQLTNTLGTQCPDNPISTTLKLRGDPLDPITVTITSNQVFGTSAPTSLMYTSMNYSTLQSVTFNSTQGPAQVLYDFKVVGNGLVTQPRYTMTVRDPGQPICNL